MSARAAGLTWGIVAAALSAGCASQQSISNPGMVTVGGLAPYQVLAAIDTTKLVGSRPDRVAANQPANSGSDSNPEADHSKAIAVGGVAPSAVLAAIDTSKLVTPPPGSSDDSLDGGRKE